MKGKEEEESDVLSITKEKEEKKFDILSNFEEPAAGLDEIVMVHTGFIKGPGLYVRIHLVNPFKGTYLAKDFQVDTGFSGTLMLTKDTFSALQYSPGSYVIKTRSALTVNSIEQYQEVSQSNIDLRIPLFREDEPNTLYYEYNIFDN